MWSLFSRDPAKDFAYEINDLVVDWDDDKSFWSLHQGKKKATGEPVSIFRYECKPNEESHLELARNSLKRLKTLRHPSILTYTDSLETEKYIIIVTEHVEPLKFFLNRMQSWTEKQKELAISWGILSVAKGVCFLNNDCKLIHGNLSISSIFINTSSDWKIFNLEYLTSIGTMQPNKHFYPHKIYIPPEVQDGRTSCDKSIDSWGLGCLIWEIFNGSLSDQTQLKNTKKLPKNLVPLYLSLIKNSSSRCLIMEFIEKGKDKNGYFKNIFIDTMNFVEEIQIKDSTEKNRFFSNLNNLLESFPKYFCKNKILPFVITSLEYGEANHHCLDLLIKIGKSLEENEYQKKVMPTIIKLFASKDRSIRSKLLKELEEYINFTTASAVNEQIFPYLVHGFLDSNPVIREQTVKSIFHLASKLNAQNLNDEVIKHFSRIQMKDPEGGIRTNTIICLGKIASHLQPSTRQNMMLPLFLRSLRDPFPPSRIACIQSLCATQNFFPLQECTTKIMPALCLILMDPEKLVRDQAFLALKNFIQKIEQFSENPALIEQMESEINKSGSNVSSKFTTGLSWAVSSLAAKLTRSKMENATNHNETSISENELKSKTISQTNMIDNNNGDISVAKTSEHQISVQQKSEDAKISDDYLVASDGWGDDNWEDNLLKELEVKPQKTMDPIQLNSTIMTVNDDRNEKKNTNLHYNDWDEDFDWKDASSNHVQEEDRPLKSMNLERDPEINQTMTTTAIKAGPTITRSNISSSSKPSKKGPMKLGAQKLKKPLID